jgi:Glyoxalase-like domain
MIRPRMEITGPVLDAADPVGLARFYERWLGWAMVESEVHLDIAVEDLDEGVPWAVEAGATLAAHQPQAGVRVMLDPAGHPFCLFAG